MAVQKNTRISMVKVAILVQITLNIIKSKGNVNLVKMELITIQQAAHALARKKLLMKLIVHVLHVLYHFILILILSNARNVH